MEKFSSDATLLKTCLESLDLDKLAEESQWSAKSRKVNALSWCLSLCLASSGKAPSLRTAAVFMGLINLLTVSKQALYKRLNKGGGTLIKKALEAAIATKAHCSNRSLKGFKRVLIQDSTCNRLPKSLEKHYPGSKNQYGSSAVMRIQAIYDMASNRFVEFALGAFTRNDQAAALDILEFVEKDDLILRDLGYMSLESLKRIGDANAYYLSRYANTCLLFDKDTGEELKLREIVRSNRTVEVDVLLGSEVKLPVRLIAVPLKEEVANRRRQKAKSNRDLRKNPSKETLELLGWQIMITNCQKERLPAAYAFEIYSMRWRIETIFKSWKSGLCIDDITTHTSREMLDAIIHAALLRITLIHAVLIPWLEARDPSRKVSLTKLMDLIALSAALVGVDAAANENLLENLSKHCRYDKRKRVNTLERWDLLISEMENLS
jgi:hypothetical protein